MKKYRLSSPLVIFACICGLCYIYLVLSGHIGTSFPGLKMSMSVVENAKQQFAEEQIAVEDTSGNMQFIKRSEYDSLVAKHAIIDTVTEKQKDAKERSEFEKKYTEKEPRTSSFRNEDIGLMLPLVLFAGALFLPVVIYIIGFIIFMICGIGGGVYKGWGHYRNKMDLFPHSRHAKVFNVVDSVVTCVFKAIDWLLFIVLSIIFFPYILISKFTGNRLHTGCSYHFGGYLTWYIVISLISVWGINHFYPLSGLQDFLVWVGTLLLSIIYYHLGPTKEILD